MKPQNDVVRAWHFVGKTLRDGRAIPKDGEWLICPDSLIICERGLHASRDPYDALQYAPGDTLCLVDCAGERIEQADKLVCAERRIVARMDAAEMLCYFARMQALSVVHLWDAPDVVLDWLMTGDETVRASAYASAHASTYASARASANASTYAYARTYASARASANASTYAYANASDNAYASAYASTYASARASAYAREEFNALVAECFEGVL